MMTEYIAIGTGTLTQDFPQFKNPQWIAKLQQYSVEDAFDIVMWLHERLQGYPCFHLDLGPMGGICHNCKGVFDNA
jgi:hypothetical protein